MANELEPFDIVQTGLARHGHQYGQSLLFRLWIAKTLNPLINVQDAFFELLDIDVDTAEGVKLALIGRIVGAPPYCTNTAWYTRIESRLATGQISGCAALPKRWFCFKDSHTAASRRYILPKSPRQWPILLIPTIISSTGACSTTCVVRETKKLNTQ